MYSQSQSQKRGRSSSAGPAKRVKTTRKNFRGTKTVVVSPNQGLVPISYTSTLKYQEVVQFTALVGAGNYYQFNLNSIYDPNYTSTGHQPMGRDQLEGLYGKYRVNSVRYQVIPFLTTGAYASMWVGPINTTSSVGVGFKEYPSTQTRLLNQYNASTTAVVNGNVNLWELASTTKAKYDADDLFAANMSNDPTEKMLLTIYIDNAITGVTATILATVTMWMNVTCYDRVELAQS